VIGAQLQARRLTARVSLRSLAARMGISPPYLCDLEWGRRSGERAQSQIARAALILREMIAEKKCKAKAPARPVSGGRTLRDVREEKDLIRLRIKDKD
jgi:transcriptional regulator with XRE-family HTH domain